MTTMTRNDKQTDQTDETLETARNAFEISISNFSSDHTEVVENMQKVVEILLAKKQFAEALKEIEQLKKLAISQSPVLPASLLAKASKKSKKISPQKLQN